MINWSVNQNLQNIFIGGPTRVVLWFTVFRLICSKALLHTSRLIPTTAVPAHLVCHSVNPQVSHIPVCSTLLQIPWPVHLLTGSSASQQV